MPWHLTDHLIPGGNNNSTEEKKKRTAADTTDVNNDSAMADQAAGNNGSISEGGDKSRGESCAEHSEDSVDRSEDQLGFFLTPPLRLAPGVVFQAETTVAQYGHPAATATTTTLSMQAAAKTASECSSYSRSSPQAPMPSLPPRHGVRVDPVAGAGNGSVVYQRYCHVYVEGELDELIGKVEGLRLLTSYYDRSNWCVLAEREGST